MRRSVPCLIAAVLLGALFCGANENSDKDSITVVSISEFRIRADESLEKLHMKLPKSGGLTLDMKIQTTQSYGASRYGNWRIERAVDDAGTDLNTAEQDAGMIGIDSRLYQPKGPQFTLVMCRLGVPARRATRIVSLRGELQMLAGGQLKIIRVSPIRAALDKPLHDPVLDQAKLHVELNATQGDPHEFGLKETGEMSALRKVEVVDPDGTDETAMAHPSGDGTYTAYSIAAKRPLDDKLVLQLHVALDQKVVTVPFDLKDIPLR